MEVIFLDETDPISSPMKAKGVGGLGISVSLRPSPMRSTTCLDGCPEIEAMYPQAKQANFAERFIRTTGNWGPPWINDRIYPWRPFVHVPRAWAIDELLKKVLGQEMFAQITLK